MYSKKIRDFKIAMQKGKEFQISTLSDASEFICYMSEGSSTLKLRTSTGNERYTTFKNIERYFKNEAIKDEKNYVIAVCEWLENTNLDEDIKFDYEKIKNTLNLFTKNHQRYLQNGRNGDYYNIFIEANIAGQEIRHSKYLANLFNSLGNHFHSNLFFKHFLEELKLYEILNQCDAIANFNIQKYYITTEEYDSENEEKKGFLDIVISDDKYMIIIENKTGTKDHTGQLLRYKEYAENKKEKGNIKDYIILYLTPNGDNPTDINACNDDKIVSINYIQDIRNSMLNAKEFIHNDILKTMIQQYINSIPLYVYKLPMEWEYELDIIDNITKDIKIFKQCDDITNIVNNMSSASQIFNEEELLVAKKISKYFVKSKAKIERDFMLELSDKLDISLEDEKFEFSRNSNILVNDFTDNNDIDLYYDINSIYEVRKIRQRGIPKNKFEEYYDELRQSTKSCIVYEKPSFMLFIQIDISGLHASLYKNDNEVYTLINYEYILNPENDLFGSRNISKLLDKKYSQKVINQCINQIAILIKN